MRRRRWRGEGGRGRRGGCEGRGRGGSFVDFGGEHDGGFALVDDVHEFDGIAVINAAIDVDDDCAIFAAGEFGFECGLEGVPRGFLTVEEDFFLGVELDGNVFGFGAFCGGGFGEFEVDSGDADEAGGDHEDDEKDE